MTTLPEVPIAFREGPGQISRAVSEGAGGGGGDNRGNSGYKKGPLDALREGESPRREPNKFPPRPVRDNSREQRDSSRDQPRNSWSGDTRPNSFRGGAGGGGPFQNPRPPRFDQRRDSRDPRRRDGRFPVGSSPLSPSPSRSHPSPNFRGASPRGPTYTEEDLSNLPALMSPETEPYQTASDDMVSWYSKGELLTQFTESVKPPELDDETVQSVDCLHPINLLPPSEAEQGAKSAGAWWILSRAYQASQAKGRRGGGVSAWRDRQTFGRDSSMEPISRARSLGDELPERKDQDGDGQEVPEGQPDTLRRDASDNNQLSSPQKQPSDPGTLSFPLPKMDALQPRETSSSRYDGVPRWGLPEKPKPVLEDLHVPRPDGRPSMWYYRDPQGNIQGPFSGEEMRAWYDEGFFRLDLQIQCDLDLRTDKTVFLPLQTWFARGNKAFLETIPALSLEETIPATPQEPAQVPQTASFPEAQWLSVQNRQQQQQPERQQQERQQQERQQQERQQQERQQQERQQQERQQQQQQQQQYSYYHQQQQQKEAYLAAFQQQQQQQQNPPRTQPHLPHTATPQHQQPQRMPQYPHPEGETFLRREGPQWPTPAWPQQDHEAQLRWQEGQARLAPFEAPKSEPRNVWAEQEAQRQQIEQERLAERARMERERQELERQAQEERERQERDRAAEDERQQQEQQLREQHERERQEQEEALRVHLVKKAEQETLAAGPPKTWEIPKKPAVPSLFETQQREREEQQQLELQEMELRQRLQEKLALEAPSAEEGGAGSVWGSVPVAAAVVAQPKKSLQQIQAEQERLEHEQNLIRGSQRRQETPRADGFSWKGAVAPARVNTGSKSLLDIQKEQLTDAPEEPNTWGTAEYLRRSTSAPAPAPASKPQPVVVPAKAWAQKTAPSPTPAGSWSRPPAAADPKTSTPVVNFPTPSVPSPWVNPAGQPQNKQQQQQLQQQFQLLQQFGVVKPAAATSQPPAPSPSSATAPKAPSSQATLAPHQQPPPSLVSQKPKAELPSLPPLPTPSPGAKKTPPKPKKGKGSVANVFGGPSMSQEMEEWCKGQLERIGADITLAHYLMTIESPTQIEEYIRQYLGNAEGAQEFTAGFLQHKQFDAGEKPQVAAEAGTDEESKKKNRRRARAGGGAK